MNHNQINNPEEQDSEEGLEVPSLDLSFPEPQNNRSGFGFGTWGRQFDAQGQNSEVSALDLSFSESSRLAWVSWDPEAEWNLKSSEHIRVKEKLILLEKNYRENIGSETPATLLKKLDMGKLSAQEKTLIEVNYECPIDHSKITFPILIVTKNPEKPEEDVFGPVDLHSMYNYCCFDSITNPFTNKAITADNLHGVDAEYLAKYLLPLKKLVEKYPLQKEANEPESSVIQPPQSRLR